MSVPFLVDTAWLQQRFPELSDLQPLATGGQRQVLSARHNRDGDIVMKLMHPGSDPERIKRELDATAKIVAPRMPQIYDHGTIAHQTGTYVWIREQRILGEPLNDRTKIKPLSVAETLRLALHVSETLVAAEMVRIVHRDVKPPNIILDPTGGFWLIDFGFARHLALESITATAAPGGWGTLGYAPIEQCRNLKPEIDARADLFALGVTIFEAATGVNPHLAGARDQFQVIDRVARIALPRLNPPMPPDFADLVATLAQPSRVHRPPTAHEALEWIREICYREGVR